MIRSRTLTFTALVAGALVAGCAAPSKSGHTYTTSEARRPMQVQTGVVQAIREVRLERERPSGVGTGAGAVIGGLAGCGSIVGTVLGAVAGGVVGSHVEQSTSDRPALEITVRTDAGKTFAVVQESGGETFAPGQRVRILTDPSRGTTRVSQ